MNHPSQLLSRALRQRSRAVPIRRSVPTPAPAAPAGIAPAMPGQSPAPQAAAFQPSQPIAPPPLAAPPAAPPEEAAPRRPAGHALYSQIMRSHDRMGTRHL